MERDRYRERGREGEERLGKLAKAVEVRELERGSGNLERGSGITKQLILCLQRTSVPLLHPQTSGGI